MNRIRHEATNSRLLDTAAYRGFQTPKREDGSFA